MFYILHLQFIEAMYCSVIFEKTNEMEVVPATWVSGEECMWPPNKVDVKATKSQEQPGAGWKPYRIRVTFTSSKYNCLDSGTC